MWSGSGPARKFIAMGGERPDFHNTACAKGFFGCDAWGVLVKQGHRPRLDEGGAKGSLVGDLYQSRANG